MVGSKAVLATLAIAAGLAAAAAQEIGSALAGERPYRVEGGVVKVLVSSSGCTSAAYFEMSRKDAEGGSRIELKRIRRDACKAFFPEGRWVAFPAIAVPAPGGPVLHIVER